MLAYWHALGVQKKLHLLIQGAFIVLFVLLINWVIGRFETQIVKHAEQRALQTADGLINGMNMLMVTGQISDPDNRKLMLTKMRQSEGVNDVRMVRGKGVVAQFGKGLWEEQPQDDLEREVLANGKLIMRRIEVPGQRPALRVLVPFIAQQNFRGTNCLMCHDVPVGSVNGAASVVIDLSQDYLELATIKEQLWLGNIPIQILLSLLIWFAVRKLIVRNIVDPIHLLQSTMAEIQHSKDLAKRAFVDEHNPDIASLAGSFNVLLENLEQVNNRLQLFSRLFDNSGEGIIITDALGYIVAVNPAFEKITRYSAAAVVGRNPRLLSSGRQSPEFYRQMWMSLNATGAWSGELWNRRQDGEIYPEWVSMGVVKNSRGEVTNYISLFLDITKRKEAELRIQFLAHYDALTKLPNRALFADRLRHALHLAERGQSKLALLFMDLDKFKSINDTLGHLAGDQLLQSVADRLKAAVRVTDTVCRQSGDEFMILLEDVSSFTDVETIAANILLAMEAPHHLGDEKRVVSCSIGAAMYPDDARDDESLIRCADQAMYVAKHSGRNNFKRYSPSAA